MHHMVGVMYEIRTAYPSRAQEITTCFSWGSCCSSFQLSVLCFSFVSLHSVSCVPHCVSRLSILDCHFFYNVYLVASFNKPAIAMSVYLYCSNFRFSKAAIQSYIESVLTYFLLNLYVYCYEQKVKNNATRLKSNQKLQFLSTSDVVT